MEVFETEIQVSNRTLVSAVNEALSKSPSDLTMQLNSAYREMSKKASAWITASNRIVVTDETHTDGMKMARLLRLELKGVRCDAEAKRKELKQVYLDGGRAVDGIAKIIKDAIEPIEETLSEKENFIAVKEARRLAVLMEQRRAVIAGLGKNPDLYNLSEFTAEQFDAVVSSIGYEIEGEKKRLAEEAQQKIDAEAKRVAEEQAARLQRIENLRLQKLVQKAADDLAAERAETERKARETEAARAAEAKAAQDKLDTERRAAQAVLDAERKAASEAARSAEMAIREKEAELARERAERYAAGQKAMAELERQERAAKRRAELVDLNIDPDLHQYNYCDFTDNEWLAFLEKQRTNIAHMRLREEKQKADLEEVKRTAPDREKLQAYMKSLLDTPRPEMSTKRGGEVLYLIVSKMLELSGIGQHGSW